MSNYPDNMGDDSHLDSDETGNRLTCGCYEEQCECPCEHDNFDIVNEEAFAGGITYVHYHCSDCDANGVAKYTFDDIIWGEEE
jgi:hypothetical protein